METDVTFRFANSEDLETILDFIKALAEYEKLENEVIATPELLNEWIFEKGKAEVIFALANGKEVGFVLPQLLYLLGPCRNLPRRPFCETRISRKGYRESSFDKAQSNNSRAWLWSFGMGMS